MFGSVGGPEILLIFILALLLFGPRKLPEIGRTLGKTVAEFRKATNEFRATLEREVELENLKEAKKTVEGSVLEPVAALRGLELIGTTIPSLLSRVTGTGPAPATPIAAGEVQRVPAATPAVKVPFEETREVMAPEAGSAGSPPTSAPAPDAKPVEEP